VPANSTAGACLSKNLAKPHTDLPWQMLVFSDPHSVPLVRMTSMCLTPHNLLVEVLRCLVWC
jgi:hypothetical protein